MNAWELAEDCSLDMAGRHLGQLADAASLLPAGTRVYVGVAADESPELRRRASAEIVGSGLIPVPHLAARRIGSRAALERILTGWRMDGTSRHLLILGGDPLEPEGPYDSALSLLRATRLAAYGVETVGIAGHPDGHPAIGGGALWAALRAKVAEIDAQGLRVEIVTQIALAPDPVVAWIERVRRSGIAAPIRIGLCGPIEAARLRGYARRVGAPWSREIEERHAISADDPSRRVGPARLIEEFAERLDPAVHGDVRLHLFSLGGLLETAGWVRDARRRCPPG